MGTCLILALLLAQSAHARREAIAGASFVPGRIVVRFRDVTAPAQRAATLAEHGLMMERELAALGVTLLRVPSGRELAIAARLSRDPSVVYAEPDYELRLLAVPNDPYYAPRQRNLRQIGLEAAWDTTTGAAQVIVAVLDTGADLTHPDLAAKLVPGYDFAFDDSIPADDHGHGSHVAGIVGAASDNGIGVAGVAWGSRIMPVKVFDESGTGTDSSVAEGICWAADHDARIINISGGTTAAGLVVRDAVAYAVGKGCLVIAAAGNGYESGNVPHYPAAFPQVVAVGAVGHLDEHARYSNTGAYLDVVAPGGNPTGPSDPDNDHWIYSTFYRGSGRSYADAAGTSAAAPHVAGLAALLWSVNPALSAAEACCLIARTAVDLGAPGWDEVFGWGRIDAAAAVAAAARAVAQRIPLHAGWNWVTLTVAPCALTLPDALASIAGRYDLVLGEEGTYAPPPANPAYNTLARLTPGRAYLIRMSEPGELALWGAPLDASVPFALRTGWQWVGYLPACAQEVGAALASIAGAYDLVLGESGAYAPPADAARNTLSELVPGAGYMIRLTQDATLVYPPCGGE